MSQVLPFYQVDAFTAEGSLGNPAAIIVVSEFPEAQVMQQVAAENNLSETAFIKRDGSVWDIRWFTPSTEVGLCGHATLAAAYVLQTFYSDTCAASGLLEFRYAQGCLTVATSAEGLSLSLPAESILPADINNSLCQALQVKALAAYSGFYYTLVLESEADVVAAKPNMPALQQAWPGGLIITAPGSDSDVDFVSRFFAPGMGIDEDPVTGSAHCITVPYWSAELGRVQLRAKQLSPRGGDLQCQYQADTDRVILQGRCRLVIKGEYYL